MIVTPKQKSLHYQYLSSTLAWRTLALLINSRTLAPYCQVPVFFSTHDAVLKNPSSPSSLTVCKQYAEVCSEAQKLLWWLQNNWWKNRAAEIQLLADQNDLHRFYDAIKKVCGPTRGSCHPIRLADGNSLIKDRQAQLTRWAEHFGSLLTASTQATLMYLTSCLTYLHLILILLHPSLRYTIPPIA